MPFLSAAHETPRKNLNAQSTTNELGLYRARLSSGAGTDETASANDQILVGLNLNISKPEPQTDTRAQTLTGNESTGTEVIVAAKVPGAGSRDCRVSG